MHYLHQALPRDELAAFFLAADVMLVTPLRDGMNLVAKEYVACRSDLGGALVLSEFAGAAVEMTQPTCQPARHRRHQATIAEAVNAPEAENRKRMKRCAAR